jgi:hypothetical protein
VKLSKEEIGKVKCVFGLRGKVLSRRAIHQLIPFACPNFYETASLKCAVNTEYSKRINTIPLFSIHISNIKPHIKIIFKEEKEEEGKKPPLLKFKFARTWHHFLLQEIRFFTNICN